MQAQAQEAEESHSDKAQEALQGFRYPVAIPVL